MQQENVKKFEKLIKIVETVEENPYIFYTIKKPLMKFSGKMQLMIMLKVTKRQGFTLFLENAFLEKSQGGGGDKTVDKKG